MQDGELVMDDDKDLIGRRILETGFAFRGGRWSYDDDEIPPRVADYATVVGLCRDYAIQNPQDVLSMAEYAVLSGMRFDMLTIDLGHHTVRGFEIKMSRSDWLRDEKWHLYLKYVNFFYLVAPAGVIKPTEVPREVYLMEPVLVEAPWRFGGPTGLPFYELKVVKRGQRLQPRFVRETYTESFYNRLLLEYIRKIQWRKDQCPWCEAAKSGDDAVNVCHGHIRKVVEAGKRAGAKDG